MVPCLLAWNGGSRRQERRFVYSCSSRVKCEVSLGLQLAQASLVLHTDTLRPLEEFCLQHEFYRNSTSSYPSS